MKIAALCMAALLALSLTGCMDSGRNHGSTGMNPSSGVTGNENSGNSASGSNGSDTNGTVGNVGSGTNSGASGGTGNTGDTGNTGSGSTSNSGTGDTTGKPQTGTHPEERSVMYNGALYEVTDQRLADDEVGVELFSITSLVDDTPAEDGDALGLQEGTKVYRIRDDNEYDEIAVEIDDAYYKAVRR